MVESAGNPASLNLDVDIEAQLAAFEAEERRRLGLDDVKEHWHDPVPQGFTRKERDSTTILVSGLTMAHDYLIEGALKGVGYVMQHMDCPDYEALRFGKEFGNRAQCNPTYFTVGNLIKELTKLRDEQGLTNQQIVDGFVFVTAGACGPCRFGTYVTEYRKALRDAGFNGFRVLLFQQTGGLKQATGDDQGLEMNPAFFIAVVKALLIGDVLNALAYRIRPYEVEKGSTDAALDDCKARISEALSGKKMLVPVLLACKKRLAEVAVDRTKVKPRVSIIGAGDGSGVRVGSITRACHGVLFLDELGNGKCTS